MWSFAVLKLGYYCKIVCHIPLTSPVVSQWLRRRPIVSVYGNKSMYFFTEDCAICPSLTQCTLSMASWCLGCCLSAHVHTSKRCLGSTVGCCRRRKECGVSFTRVNILSFLSDLCFVEYHLTLSLFIFCCCCPSTCFYFSALCQMCHCSHWCLSSCIQRHNGHR